MKIPGAKGFEDVPRRANIITTIGSLNGSYGHVKFQPEYFPGVYIDVTVTDKCRLEPKQGVSELIFNRIPGVNVHGVMLSQTLVHYVNIEKVSLNKYGWPIAAVTELEEENFWQEQVKYAAFVRLYEENLVKEQALICTNCHLCTTRNNVVWGRGKAKAPVMIIGEAPGADEDRTGKPFVGRAGALLTQLLTEAKFTADDYYITNVVKCRPPQNRTPSAGEIGLCVPYLEYEIVENEPEVIITLGATATKAMIDLQAPITQVVGQWFDFGGIKLMPTYHPAYLLRNPGATDIVRQHLKQAWEALIPF